MSKNKAVINPRDVLAKLIILGLNEYRAGEFTNHDGNIINVKELAKHCEISPVSIDRVFDHQPTTKGDDEPAYARLLHFAYPKMNSSEISKMRGIDYSYVGTTKEEAVKFKINDEGQVRHILNKFKKLFPNYSPAKVQLVAEVKAVPAQATPVKDISEFTPENVLYKYIKLGILKNHRYGIDSDGNIIGDKLTSIARGKLDSFESICQNTVSKRYLQSAFTSIFRSGLPWRSLEEDTGVKIDYLNKASGTTLTCEFTNKGKALEVLEKYNRKFAIFEKPELPQTTVTTVNNAAMPMLRSNEASQSFAKTVSTFPQISLVTHSSDVVFDKDFLKNPAEDTKHNTYSVRIAYADKVISIKPSSTANAENINISQMILNKINDMPEQMRNDSSLVLAALRKYDVKEGFNLTVTEKTKEVSNIR